MPIGYLQKNSNRFNNYLFLNKNNITGKYNCCEPLCDVIFECTIKKFDPENDKVTIVNFMDSKPSHDKVFKTIRCTGLHRKQMQLNLSQRRTCMVQAENILLNASSNCKNFCVLIHNESL